MSCRYVPNPRPATRQFLTYPVQTFASFPYGANQTWSLEKGALVPTYSVNIIGANVSAPGEPSWISGSDVTGESAQIWCGVVSARTLVCVCTEC